MWTQHNQYYSDELSPVRMTSVYNETQLIAYRQAKLSSKTKLTISSWDKRKENHTPPSRRPPPSSPHRPMSQRTSWSSSSSINDIAFVKCTCYNNSEM